VVKHGGFSVVIGVPGDLSTRDHKIVAAAEFHGDSQLPDRQRDDFNLPLEIVVTLIGDEREIEVAEVVKHGAAPRRSAGQLPAVGFEPRTVAFFPGILVASDDDGRLILP